MKYTKFNALLDIGLRAGDLFGVVAAAYVAYRLRFETWQMSAPYEAALLMLALTTVTLFLALKVYEQPAGRRLATTFFRVAASWVLSFAAVIAVGYLLQLGANYSRGWVGLFFAIGLAFLTAIRFIGDAFLAMLHRRGIGMGRCLLIGATESGMRMHQHASISPQLGMRITGYVKTPYDQGVLPGVPVSGSLSQLDEVLDRGGWDQVLIALPLSANRAISYVLDRTEERVVAVKFVPDLLGRQLINHRMQDCAGVPVVTLRESPLQGHGWMLKALEDRLIAAVILLLISPLMALLAIGVKLSSPGPILYRQVRVGLDGKEFEMLKFRSMPVDLEQGKSVQWGSAASKTTTRFGRFIRQTSLDELPQFINVLRGDMSIVGPRPERPMWVQKFKSEIPGYMHKHLVKAGITGWAQINGWRGDTDLVKRIECDLYYISHWSLAFDLKIIFLTIFKGFVHSEAKATGAAAAEASAPALRSAGAVSKEEAA